MPSGRLENEHARDALVCAARAYSVLGTRPEMAGSDLMSWFMRWLVDQDEEYEQRVIDLLTREGPPLSGHDIGRITGLSSGRLRPVLAYLENVNLIEGDWVAGPDTRVRLYQLKRKQS